MLSKALVLKLTCSKLKLISVLNSKHFHLQKHVFVLHQSPSIYINPSKILLTKCFVNKINTRLLIKDKLDLHRLKSVVMMSINQTINWFFIISLTLPKTASLSSRLLSKLIDLQTSSAWYWLNFEGEVHSYSRDEVCRCAHWHLSTLVMTEKEEEAKNVNIRWTSCIIETKNLKEINEKCHLCLLTTSCRCERLRRVKKRVYLSRHRPADYAIVYHIYVEFFSSRGENMVAWVLGHTSRRNMEKVSEGLCLSLSKLLI